MDARTRNRQLGKRAATPKHLVVRVRSEYKY
jgi:hypothetical protein